MGPDGSREALLLTGTYPRTLDDKKRLTFPKQLRDKLENPPTLYVTPGPDQTLWIYTHDELEKLAARLDQAPATDAEVRVFRRLYFAQTEAVDVDRSGRILISERLSQFANLQQEVVLIGVRDHLELWDAKRWQAFVDQHSAEFDTKAERAFC